MHSMRSIQNLLEGIVRLEVRDRIDLEISDEIPEPGRKLLRALDPARYLAEALVERIPQFQWVLEHILREGSHGGLASDLHGSFRRHPLREDPVAAGLVEKLCDTLRLPPGITTVVIHEEALGRYFSRQQRIVLYPRVIGPTADDLGVPEEDLATVVLAHEVAHAVTHLGLDADHRKWDAFAGADSWVKEGMAQYWARLVLEALGGDLVGGFLKLQARQSRPYRLWQELDGLPRERVRACLVAARAAEPKATWEFCRGWLSRGW